jgi:hypothetical protein
MLPVLGFINYLLKREIQTGQSSSFPVKTLSIVGQQLMPHVDRDIAPGF